MSKFFAYTDACADVRNQTEIPGGSPNWGYTVALKKITSRRREFLQEEKAFIKTQGLMGDHLIKMICSFRRGDDYFFLLPIAEGGDLISMWYGLNDTPRTEARIKWFLSQMEGISGAIRSLNELNQREDGTGPNGRHGDIKPENILHFVNGAHAGFGVLKISDLGLAKFHQEVTEARQGPTTETRYSKPYAPPEGFKDGLKRSRTVSSIRQPLELYEMLRLDGGVRHMVTGMCLPRVCRLGVWGLRVRQGLCQQQK